MNYIFLSRYLVENKMSFDELCNKIKEKETTHERVCAVIFRATEMIYYSSAKRLLDGYTK